MKKRVLKGLMAYAITMLTLTLIAAIAGQGWLWAITSITAHIVAAAVTALTVVEIDLGPEECEYCGNCKHQRCCLDADNDYFP